jgi:ABC-2 type transport system permease protein
MRKDRFDSYMQDFQSAFEQVRVNKAGVSNDQLVMINMPVTSDVIELQEGGKLPNEVNMLNDTQYYTFLGLIIACIMILSFSAETVSSSVVNEKGNKLVENLMVSVDTNALIVGKVAGALSVVVIQLVLMFGCGFASALINMFMFNMDSFEVPSQIKEVFGAQGLISFGIGKTFLCLLMLLLGVVFFALLAALLGSAISRVEEMAEGMKAFSFLLVLGAYSAIALSIAKMGGTDVKAICLVACCIPFTSMFVVPLELLCGEISLLQGLGFAALLIVFIVLMILFVTRVYRVMILYKGERVKLKTMIGIAREKGGAA